MLKLNILMILCIICVVTTSCNTTTQYIPLKDSGIPFQMATGVYTSTKGQTYNITKESPRWSVSETYLYDSVLSKTNSVVSDNKLIKEITPIVTYCCFIIVIVLISLFFCRKRKVGCLCSFFL